jgi:hypothetical protein
MTTATPRAAATVVFADRLMCRGNPGIGVSATLLTGTFRRDGRGLGSLSSSSPASLSSRVATGSFAADDFWIPAFSEIDLADCGIDRSVGAGADGAAPDDGSNSGPFADDPFAGRGTDGGASAFAT